MSSCVSVLNHQTSHTGSCPLFFPNILFRLCDVKKQVFESHPAANVTNDNNTSSTLPRLLWPWKLNRMTDSSLFGSRLWQKGVLDHPWNFGHGVSHKRPFKNFVLRPVFHKPVDWTESQILVIGIEPNTVSWILVL